MRNFKLEYEDLRRIRPDIIMVSSTGYGYTGPWANYGAIGYTTEATSGLSHISGYEDGPPVLPEIPYADYTAAEHTAFAIMAALAYRARTGKGQFIDVSQSETLTSTIPEAMMDYAVNGRMPDRVGNQHSLIAPHGCYRCLGDDKWIAIAISTNEQWRSLCQVFGQPEWRSDPRFSDSSSRWQHRDAIDALLSRATEQRDQNELMNALQAAGVPAGAVLDGKSLLFDPHLIERGFYEVAEHSTITGIPPLPYASRPWKFSRTPSGLRSAAPTLGQHNRFVLSEIMGKPTADIEEMESRGAIGTTPPAPRSPRVVPVKEQLRRGQIFGHDSDYRDNLAHHYPT